MSRRTPPKRLYTYRGQIERGARYQWVNGYSASSETGAPYYPWMTRRECQQDARRDGMIAVFIEHHQLERG